MEKPLCRLCQHRHWSSEPHTFAASEPEKSPLAVAVKKITKPKAPKKSDGEKAAACPERHGQPKPGIVVGYDYKAAAECPVCAERKAKQAAATKRWREKKK
jgi:hypothetical protein